MILDELVLYNFGAYGGRQAIKLTPPSSDKPIVLVGGLNGVGKTTLLDAVQLVLFGKLAPCSGRGRRPYHDYLSSIIHNGVPRSQGAAVELAFRYRLEGVEQQVRITRRWRSTGKGVREVVEATRNNEPDVFLSDHWLESVEQIVPIGVARLVFFDGEKIESLADPETASAVLAAGINGLLGLDVVDRLATDLAVYEHRQALKLNQDHDNGEIRRAENAVQQLAAERERLVVERAERQNSLDAADKILQDKEARFLHEGGDLFEQRQVLESQRDLLVRQIADVENNLRDRASGLAPLLLVSDFIAATSHCANAEVGAVESSKLHAMLADRDSTVIAELRRAGLDETAISRIESVLDADRKARLTGGSANVALALPDPVRHDLARITAAAVGDARRELQGRRSRLNSLRAELAAVEKKCRAVPGKDAIASLLTERANAQADAAAADRSLQRAAEALAKTIRAHEQARSKHEQLLVRAAALKLDQDDLRRSMAYAAVVRSTLAQYRHALLARSTKRIAGLVLDGVRNLLHKRRLVSELEIDPNSFDLKLMGPDATELPPDRLSAGERQLLAIALLWGLARAAGRPLPAIVDTPLGRLDSSHRMHLVDRYFPVASHQVLLLSTDEEITASYWAKLRRHVGRSYTLVYDDETASTRIERGYFW